MTHAPVLRSITVPVPPARAFRVFTEQIAAWWPAATHGLFGHEAGRVAFEAGRLVERATDGRETIWGEVLAWDEPVRLCFTWHPGREADDASEVEVRFLESGTDTRVELEHRGWERFGQDASARRRTYVGPGAWGAVLEHFADVAEPPSDPADHDALREAYDAFHSEASGGGFGPPPDGEWDALQTIAHVTLNDYAMAAVMQSIIHARPITFANTVCQDRAVLARHIDRFAGDLASLVAQGRAAAATVIALLGRLSPAQRETLVHCHLLHDGEVVLDAEMPWSQIAIDAQAGRHLPAHIGQLRDLRESEAQGSDAQDSDAR